MISMISNQINYIVTINMSIFTFGSGLDFLCLQNIMNHIELPFLSFIYLRVHPVHYIGIFLSVKFCSGSSEELLSGKNDSKVFRILDQKIHFMKQQICSFH